MTYRDDAERRVALLGIFIGNVVHGVGFDLRTGTVTMPVRRPSGVGKFTQTALLLVGLVAAVMLPVSITILDSGSVVVAMWAFDLGVAVRSFIDYLFWRRRRKEQLGARV